MFEEELRCLERIVDEELKQMEVLSKQFSQAANITERALILRRKKLDLLASQGINMQEPLPLNEKEYRKALCRALMDRSLGDLAKHIEKSESWIIDKLKENPNESKN